MPRKLVSDELWSQIEPLLPKHKPTPKGGRPRIPDRAALTGIIFVLKTGIPWEDLPQEMGCGSGMTCWRRLRDWQEAGVWESLHHVILQNLHDTKKIDWSRACIDGSVIQAKRGANTQGPTRVTPKFCVKSNECRNRAKFICRRQRLDRLPPMSTT